MIYALVRAVARIALRWFYRDIRVDGAERVPVRGPLLVAVNHPNALVDVLLAGTSLRRRLTLTAKATLSAQPAIGALFRLLGVVPLRRAADERARGGAGEVARNEHHVWEVEVAASRHSWHGAAHRKRFPQCRKGKSARHQAAKRVRAEW